MIPLLRLPDHRTPLARNGRMQWGDGFEIETVINCRFATAGVDIVEVPSVELLRIHGESNLNAVSDGLRVLRDALHRVVAYACPARAGAPEPPPSARAAGRHRPRHAGQGRCLTARPARTTPETSDPWRTPGCRVVLVDGPA